MVSKRVESLLNQLRTQGIVDERVLEAIALVPREKFVDEAFEHKAWENTALPIGQGQTISQPYMVARMTELLTLTPESRVLEIGTGSGYQTAILAHLVHHVCSVERIKSLQWQARRRLKQLDLHNVSTRHGDGWQGWQARAPFDAIIVTAAPPEIPTALLAQLDDDGVLVLPVGEEHQFLKRIRRRGNEFIIDTVEAVRFVPLVKGELAVSQASARASGGATTSTTSAQKSTAVVASQPTITYSESSGEQSATKMLPNNKPATTTTTVVAPVTAPTTVSTTQPTASSTSTSSPISTWRWPTDGKVIENFSGAEGGNKGIDIAGSKGQAIVATADGRVVYAGNALRGYGNLIIIKHNDDYLSAYAHNDTMLVREQQEVKAGQKIATMGSTGTSSTRLHFEIRYKGKSVNPLQYLPQR